MEYPQPHLAVGRPPDDSTTSVPLEVSDYIASVASLHCSGSPIPTQSSGATSTLVPAVSSSVPTSTARSQVSNKRTRSTSLSRTSLQESTSRDKGCVPFWNAHSLAWSRRLWSCTATDLQDSVATSWSSSSRKLALGSWFTVVMKESKRSATSQTTCLPSPAITDVVLRQIASADGNRTTCRGKTCQASED